MRQTIHVWGFLLAAPLFFKASASCLYNVVKLDGYGKFSGTTINVTSTNQPLPRKVDAWLGMDYATQPVGDGRFRPADWPTPFDGVIPATKKGKSCIQVASGFSPIDQQDEACLNFNVYRTHGKPKGQKLPVLVWIHGGSFNYGEGALFDAASFVSLSKEPMVVVTMNYRLGSLGSLPSRLFEDEGLLNLGLQDQKLFLQFVQKYIAAFGGDADTITLGGTSAGSHSVGIHQFHNYDEDTGNPLFNRVIYESGSVTARAFPNATIPLYRQQMDEYMMGLGCPQGDAKKALACLRAVGVDTIRDVNTEIFEKGRETLTFPFQPVQGGPLLEKFGSQSGYDETFFHVPTLVIYSTNEGSRWVSTSLETNSEFVDYMHILAPEMNNNDLDLLSELYPDPATDPSSPYAESTNSTQFERLATAWGDYAYLCPSQETAYRVSLARVPIWKLHFNTNNSNPAWLGIPHVADQPYMWNDPLVQYPDIGRQHHAYLASFVVSGDPNTYRYLDTPEWPQYEPQGYKLDDKPGMQLLVEPEGRTRAVRDDVRREACMYWRDPERAPRLWK
ncbi:hypothetical protein S40288_05541 [Stachybotrys chartarum IBT 40288]|nr:hypothetical protein S40288_05541 [Stachybotrys chartarum IBT 40288]